MARSGMAGGGIPHARAGRGTRCLTALWTARGLIPVARRRGRLEGEYVRPLQVTATPLFSLHSAPKHGSLTSPLFLPLPSPRLGPMLIFSWWVSHPLHSADPTCDACVLALLPRFPSSLPFCCGPPAVREKQQHYTIHMKQEYQEAPLGGFPSAVWGQEYQEAPLGGISHCSVGHRDECMSRQS